jgi:hypothetical protein
MKIAQGNQSMTDRRLREGHLERRSRPEVVVEVVRQHGPREMEIELQVAYALVQFKMQGHGLMQTMFLAVAPDLDLEVFFWIGVAVALTACACASEWSRSGTIDRRR